MTEIHLSSNPVGRRASGVIAAIFGLVLFSGGAGLLYASNEYVKLILWSFGLIFYLTSIRLTIAIIYSLLYGVFGVISQLYFSLPFKFYDSVAICLSLILVNYFIQRRLYLDHRLLLRRAILIYLVLSLIVGLFAGNFYLGGGAIGFRFLGITENPNQLGLYAACSLVILQVFGGGGYFSALCKVMALLLGVLSGSDAFYVACFAYLFLLFLSRGNINFLVGIFSILLFIIFSITYFDIASLGLQATERLNRWWCFWSLIARYPFSLLVGFGATAVGPSFDITFKDEVISSCAFDVSGTEFHNSYFDFIAAFGIVGFLVFYMFFSGLLNKRVGLFRLITTPEFGFLAVFAAFHLVYRHPVFWIAIVSVLIRASSSGVSRGRHL